MTTALTLETLRAELETLSFRQRLTRMIALGQQSRTDTGSAALLRALGDEPDFESRYLRLLSCAGSRDGAYVFARITDASRILRGAAARLVPQICSDDQVVSALEAANKTLRVTLLRGLYRRRRIPPIDRFLERMARQADPDLGRLLSWGSEGFVRGHLDRLAPRLGLSDWARLTRRHPDIALAAVRPRVLAQTESDPRLRAVANTVLRRAAITRPDAALQLARELLRREPPARVTLQPLVSRLPNGVADLLLTHDDGGASGVDLSVAAHRLSSDRLLALLERRPALLWQPAAWYRRSREKWFSRLAPETRRAVFALAGTGWRGENGIVSAGLVACLPADPRETEARRHLGLPALAADPRVRLFYAAFLPFDEARAALAAPLGSPDPDLRGAALGALIGTGRYYPDRLPDLLALLRARRNEPDPVRGIFITALAALPPSRWQTVHLADLSEILRDALDAADASPATRTAAQTLALSLMPFHAAWAAPILAALAVAQGALSFAAFADRLTDLEIGFLSPFLQPVFDAWKSRERTLFLVNTAYSLGHRLPALASLPPLLEQTLFTTRSSHEAERILALFAERLPQRFRTLIPALLQSDKSAITLPSAHEFLHRERQDLLTPFLGSTAYKGRFGTGKTVFVLPVSGGFERWTTAQQTAFSQTLTRLARDAERDLPTRLRAAARLARLPALIPPALIPPALTALTALTAESAAPLALRDAALRALAHLDAGQGVPLLTDALGDSRARIAIYALRSIVLEMPADRAIALLRAVPTDRVTVAKEVIRLLGDVDGAAAYPLLRAMDARPLHRDVRIALLRALWAHTEEEETWAILESAGANDDPAIAGAVLRIPTDRLSPLAQNRLLNLQTILLRHAAPEVRVETLERIGDQPLPDPSRLLLPPLLHCLGSPFPDETDSAARAVFTLYAGEARQDSVAVGAAMVQIRADRRVLRATLAALHAVLRENRGRLRGTVRAALHALADDPVTAEQRATLAVAGLPWEGVGEYLTRLAQTGELHAAALTAASAALAGSGSSGSAGDSDTGTGLQTLESVFASSPDERLRYLAVSVLIARSKGVSGWTGELRSRLGAYRADTSPLVAAAAQFCFPPPDSPPLSE